MNELSHKGIPCISLKASDYGGNSNLWSGAVSIQKLEKVRKLIKFKDLKDPSNSMPQERIQDICLGRMDSDGEKAILGNPLPATFVPQLIMYMKMYMDDDITRIHEELMNDMVRNFANKASHLGITFENSTEAAATTEMTHIGTTMDNDNMMEPYESQGYVGNTYAFLPVACDGIDDVFAQFQEATEPNRNEHASTSRIRNKAESEAAMHQKLKEHCHAAFYITYSSGSSINKWVDVIE